MSDTYHIADSIVRAAPQNDADTLAALYAARFQRRWQERGAKVRARVKRRIVAAEKHPAATQLRAARYAAWAREHLLSLAELPGCEALHADPALDLVSQHLWCLESEIKKAHAQPGPSPQSP